MKKSFIFCTAALLSLIAKVTIAQVAKAPSYPLLTHNPYFSVWCNADQLSTSTTANWSGKPQALYGMIKVDDTTYNLMGQLTYGATYKTILPATSEALYSAKYTTTLPTGNWQALTFNDTTWSATSKPPFTSVTQQPGTLWNTSDIWVRRKFTVTNTNISNLLLKLYNDDTAEVYLNGVLVYTAPRFNSNYVYVPIQNNLVNGQNIIAVHCHNISADSYLDFGLSQLQQAAPTVSIKNAVQKSVVVTATQTTYTFTCGKVNLTFNFMSPALLDDLALVSRPVSYISYKVSANDGAQHDVKTYFGASVNLVTSFLQVMNSTKYQANGLSILKTGSAAQNYLNTNGNLLNWGYLYVSAAKGVNATQFFSSATPNVSPFSATDTAATSLTNSDVMLNTIIPFGKVGPQTVEKVIEIGEDDVYTLQYFGQNIQPWYRSVEGSTIENELAQADTGYPSIMQRCNTFDAGLYADANKAGGTAYANICALAYRQVIAASELTKSPQGDMIYAQNEISSGGFVNTVDVVFPSSPMFLMYNPQLLEGMLNGEFYYVTTSGWTDVFAPHDIGAYPDAFGNHYPFGMPVEETGNMILMTAGICKAENSIAYAKKNWATLTKWANYLVSVGYDIPSQLTSDDFAGVIAHSVNLSAKLINAVGAYAGMARAMGDMATFNTYYTDAQNMAAQWVAKGAASGHSLLAFDQPNTWSQKYNIVWDQLLGLHLFPQSVYDNDTKYYLSQMGSYGVPLDNRQTYTKSDWSSWAAATAGSQADFETQIAPINKLITNHPDRIPFTDFYQTTNGGVQSGFKARPVQGGLFMRMLMRKWQLNNMCEVPTGLRTDNIGQTKATLHWNANPTAEKFTFEGKFADSTNWHTYTAPSTDSVYTIGGLPSGTTFQWRMASVCQSAPLAMSDYSAIQTFTTLGAKPGGIKVLVSPNPAVTTAKVTLSNTTGASDISLLDMNGNVLWKTAKTLNQTIDIPLSNLRLGVYVINIVNNGQLKQVKLMKNN